MPAKGTFFVGLRQFMIERFGEASRGEYMAFLAQKDPIFRGPILAILDRFETALARRGLWPGRLV